MSAISALPFSKIRKVRNISGNVFLSGEMPFADDGGVPAAAARVEITVVAAERSSD